MASQSSIRKSFWRSLGKTHSIYQKDSKCSATRASSDRRKPAYNDDEVEAILNARPLTPITMDPNEEEPLTPNHFLLGKSKVI